MRLDIWQEIGIVSGALLALLTLIGLIYRRVIRPVWRAAWRTIRRLNEVADDLLGDPAKNIPSMKQRMTSLEQTQAAHLEWHASPGGAPARRRPDLPNSTPRR